jgi:hypothetical protein
VCARTTPHNGPWRFSISQQAEARRVDAERREREAIVAAMVVGAFAAVKQQAAACELQVSLPGRGATVRGCWRWACGAGQRSSLVPAAVSEPSMPLGQSHAELESPLCWWQGVSAELESLKREKAAHGAVTVAAGAADVMGCFSMVLGRGLGGWAALYKQRDQAGRPSGRAVQIRRQGGGHSRTQCSARPDTVQCMPGRVVTGVQALMLVTRAPAAH